jgi:hypothetical protein
VHLLIDVCTRWFKYDRDYLCVNKSQFVPVIFEPPCIDRILELDIAGVLLRSSCSDRLTLAPGSSVAYVYYGRSPDQGCTNPGILNSVPRRIIFSV